MRVHLVVGHSLAARGSRARERAGFGKGKGKRRGFGRRSRGGGKARLYGQLGLYSFGFGACNGPVKILSKITAIVSRNMPVKEARFAPTLIRAITGIMTRKQATKTIRTIKEAACKSVVTFFNLKSHKETEDHGMAPEDFVIAFHNLTRLENKSYKKPKPENYQGAYRTARGS